MLATERYHRRGDDHRWADVGDFIREQRRLTRLSLRKLSEMAGISNPYLSQIERGMRRPSAEILQQIARALQISSESLYVRAGILDERTGAPDLPSEVRRDPYLSEEQKKILLRMYWSFRRDNGHDLVETAMSDGRGQDGHAETAE
jgi:transcriptional regulator with XRE-family HTH domain